MIDIIDNTFWLALLGVTGLLYAINWFVDQRKHTIYRISEESLTTSKKVMLKVLPLVEDGSDVPLDIAQLPFDKENVKSAAKILAYMYLKGRQGDDFNRVRDCFIALSRFQDLEQAPEKVEKRMKRERKKFRKDFDGYIKRSPFCTENLCAESKTVKMEAESEPEKASKYDG